MSKVKLSSEELQNLAERIGVSAKRSDGRVVNPDRIRVQPDLPQPDPMQALVREIKALAQRPVAVEVSIPDMPAPKVVMATPKSGHPKRWTFEFERDAEGLIQRITASSE